MDQLKAVVAQAIALLDALFAAYQAEVTKNATLTAQVADLTAQLAAAGGGTSQDVTDLTKQLGDAVTRDTPPPPSGS
jgi:hypothetical protein